MSRSHDINAPTIKPLGPELTRLSDLDDNWDSNGAPAPNDAALALAELVASSLTAANERPDRIVASADGGVAFVFVQGKKVADIEALNSGELLASTVDYDNGGSEVWELEDSDSEILAAAERFRQFFEC